MIGRNIAMTDGQLVIGPQELAELFDQPSIAARCVTHAVEALRVVAAHPRAPVEAYQALRQRAFEIRDHLLAHRLERAPFSAPACRRGCSYCCYLRVSTSIPEVLAIAARVGSMARTVRRDIARRCQPSSLPERGAWIPCSTRGLTSAAFFSGGPAAPSPRAACTTPGPSRAPFMR